MATDAQLLEQNLLMECNGNAATALKILAERYLREGDELVLIALGHERTIAELRRKIAHLKSRASRGYNQWPPVKQPRPLRLDTFEAIEDLPREGPGLDREQAPHA
jgi:hypothetical protein